MNNKDNQLELGLLPSSTQSRAAATAPRHRLTRAAWWFGQMRRMVDGAMEWSPEPAARPEQILIPGTHREIQAFPR